MAPGLPTNPLNEETEETMPFFEEEEVGPRPTQVAPLLGEVEDALLVVDAAPIASATQGDTAGSKEAPADHSRRFLGLKNQGATCYMNALLQTLFHIPYFRKVVYQIPASTVDVPCVALSLQSIFYELQCSESSVSTKKLTASFGLNDRDAFLQRDIQEFNTELRGKLEFEMQATGGDTTLEHLFGGQQATFINCINVNCASVRREPFNDLQLDVTGCRDVYASFDKYVAAEFLQGDTKYNSEIYGLQDAKREVLFDKFPRVLQLHLKRFEYDMVQNTIKKVDDRYEFPLELDLDKDDGKYLSPDADRSIRNLYTLHSVVIHRGNYHGGHYYTFIRPSLSGQWYKFDDEIVTEEDEETVLEEAFGGPDGTESGNELLESIFGEPVETLRDANAYILVYVRENEKEEMMRQVNDEDIPKHLRDEKCRKDEEDTAESLGEWLINLRTKKRATWKTRSRCLTVKVATDKDFACQIGPDIVFGLVDFDKVKSYSVRKSKPLSHFKEMVAEELGVPVEFQRFWTWELSEDECTYNLNRPLTETMEQSKVGDVGGMKVHGPNEELYLYLESGNDQGLQPIPLPDTTEEDILLFFKLYEPEMEQIRFVGSFYVKSYDMVSAILPRLKEMAGYAPDEEIHLVQELLFKPGHMSHVVYEEYTFEENELKNGDVICFQKNLSDEASKRVRSGDVSSFFHHHHDLQARLSKKPKQEELSLQP